MPTKIKLMTLNTAQLPWPLGISKHHERAHMLVEVIEHLEEQPDVITLQEMFSCFQRRYVIRKLRDDYPYICEDKRLGRKLIGVNSGLLILSKHPITNSSLFQYTISLGAGDFARKGIMCTRIQLRPGKEIVVATTHQQGGAGWSRWWPFDFYKCTHNSMIAKSVQVQEAFQQLQEFVGNDWGHIPVFYQGDFNTVDTIDHKYYEFTDFFLEGRDTFDPEKSKYQSSVWWRVNAGIPGRIDYMWNLSKQVPMYSVIVDDFSDHITDHLSVFGWAEV